MVMLLCYIIVGVAVIIQSIQLVEYNADKYKYRKLQKYNQIILVIFFYDIIYFMETVLTESYCKELIMKLCWSLNWKLCPFDIWLGMPIVGLFSEKGRLIASSCFYDNMFRDFYENATDSSSISYDVIPEYLKSVSSLEEMSVKINLAY